MEDHDMTENTNYRIVSETGFLVQEYDVGFFQEALFRALWWAWDSSQRCYIEQPGEPALTVERRNFDMYDFIPDGQDRSPERVHKLAHGTAVNLNYLLDESDAVVDQKFAGSYGHVVSVAVAVEPTEGTDDGDPVAELVRQLAADLLARETGV